MEENIYSINNGLKNFEGKITKLFKQNDEKIEQNQIYLYIAIGLNILIVGAIAMKIFGFAN